MKVYKAVIFFILSSALSTSSLFAGEIKFTKATLDKSTFAMVNGQAVSLAEYNQALSSEIKNKFYHGGASAEMIEALRMEVATRVITNTLLWHEARKRGLKADQEKIDSVISNYEKRYAGSEEWVKNKEQRLPKIIAELEKQDLIIKMKEQAQQIAKSDENAIRGYYDKHPEKFTTPVRNKVSLILLGVEPAATTETWNKAKAKAESLIFRIKNGESFAELAKEFSADKETVGQGGDMGFLHRGMLARDAEAAIDEMKSGEISRPVRILQGYAILKLSEREGAVLNDFKQVKERAASLLTDELSEKHYEQWRNQLLQSAKIVLNSNIFTEPHDGKQNSKQ